jgi:hypothetical protein
MTEAVAAVSTLSASGATPDRLAHILIALIAVVAVGRLLGVVLRAVGQPPVLGEVLGGILLGPSLLERVWPAAAEFVLPPTVAPYLEVIAHLGVLVATAGKVGGRGRRPVWPASRGATRPRGLC